MLSEKPESEKSAVLDYIFRNSGYIVMLAIIYCMTTLIVIMEPKGFTIPVLETTYDQFGASLAGFILLLSIGSYLVYRHRFTTPPMPSGGEHIWGFSFLIYSITLAGLCLQALEISFADMTDPLIFLIWRSPMILWVCGMLIGTTMLFTENKRLVYGPAALVFIFGEIWFIYGMLVVGDVIFTMYGFLYWEFVPMAFFMAILWYYYGKKAEMSSPKMVALGFFLLGVVYIAWAFWAPFDELHYIYYNWFNIYLVALGFMFAGFYALPKEMQLLVKSR
ncbi:MAG: hypothetical protein ACFFD4_18540 [Candidatus Odinarchaeota archaeon]